MKFNKQKNTNTKQNAFLVKKYFEMVMKELSDQIYNICIKATAS